MKKILFAFGLLALLFAACDEVEEATKYDNWQERNQAFADSLHVATGENYVATGEAADNMQLGKLYAIPTTAGTTAGQQYVYCRKLVANPDGERPLYTGYHSKVNTFYYRTDINGDSFDGNFTGYGATDQVIPLPPGREPTAFDSYYTSYVTENISGWIAALQLMRTGERWILYIPWQSAYGESGYNSIAGYSVLTFDLILDSIVD